MKKVIQLLVLSIGLIFFPAHAEDEFKDIVTATPALIEQIRLGGYVIYMRHGKTDSNTPDQVPIDLSDCATQRPLTIDGKAELALIGGYFNQLAIPYNTVLVSPLCRAQETAKIVFDPELVEVEVNLQYTAALTTAQKQPIIQTTFELLSKPVAAGTNRVLVAHGPNLVEMMKYFPPEGTLVFFRPLDAEGFEYLGTITPDDWPALLTQMGFTP